MADNLLATQLRKGMVIKVDNKLYRIFDRMHVTPGNLRGFVRIKMRNIQNGSMAEEKFRSEDIVERISLEQKEMQYLYNDSDGYHFMDTNTFEQVQLGTDLLGDTVGFLKPEMQVEVEFYGENPIGIEIPQTVDLKVIEARHQGRHGDQPAQARHPRNRRRRPGASLHQRRRRHPGEHRDGRIPDPRVSLRGGPRPAPISET